MTDIEQLHMEAMLELANFESQAEYEKAMLMQLEMEYEQSLEEQRYAEYQASLGL